MKIAICLSGQPRTWRSCHKRWMDMFTPQGDVDFFFHLWDYNTLPNILASHNGGIHIKDETLSSSELEDIISALAPKKHLFESRKPIKYWNTTLPEDKQFGNWCSEQFYSGYYASLLKRQYEIEHEFRYDVVIRLRSDLWFIDTPQLIKPEPNVAYTAHSTWDHRFNCYRIGDIFYYADSHTFDQISGFYKFLSFVSTDWIVRTDDCPPPEIALYFYLTNIGIINYPTHLSMKVMRTKKFAELKGHLDNYEISE